jgi:hypothetical protein
VSLREGNAAVNLAHNLLNKRHVHHLSSRMRYATRSGHTSCSGVISYTDVLRCTEHSSAPALAHGAKAAFQQAAHRHHLDFWEHVAFLQTSSVEENTAFTRNIVPKLEESAQDARWVWQPVLSISVTTGDEAWAHAGLINFVDRIKAEILWLTSVLMNTFACSALPGTDIHEYSHTNPRIPIGTMRDRSSNARAVHAKATSEQQVTKQQTSYLIATSCQATNVVLLRSCVSAGVHALLLLVAAFRQHSCCTACTRKCSFTTSHYIWWML